MNLNYLLKVVNEDARRQIFLGHGDWNRFIESEWNTAFAFKDVGGEPDPFHLACEQMRRKLKPRPELRNQGGALVKCPSWPCFLLFLSYALLITVAGTVSPHLSPRATEDQEPWRRGLGPYHDALSQALSPITGWMSAPLKFLCWSHPPLTSIWCN